MTRCSKSSRRSQRPSKERLRARALLLKWFCPADIVTLIVFQILTGACVSEPFRVAYVPIDCPRDPFFEADFRSPAQFPLQFGTVQSVTPVMPGAVLHILDQRFRLAQMLQNCADDF